MGTFYTGRSGFAKLRKGTGTLNAAMAKAMDQDIIEINQSKIALDKTLDLKPGVTIQGTAGSKRPVIVVKERQPAMLVNRANANGVFRLRHLDIQLGDQSLGLRINGGGNSTVILEDVRIYHTTKTATPYNSLLMDTGGKGVLRLENTILDMVQAFPDTLEMDRSSIGDWWAPSSRFIVKSANIKHSALQNVEFVGNNQDELINIRESVLGGYVPFSKVHVIGSKLVLAQLPSINHRGNHPFVNESEATSIAVGAGAQVELSHVRQNNKDIDAGKLPLPKWRLISVNGGNLTLKDAELAEATLKNRAIAGTLKMENVTDDSSWDVGPKIKLSNRNSQSQLFEAQSKLNITGIDKTDDIQDSKSALDQLDSMIGLDSVKKQLRRIIGQAKMNAERAKRGLGNSKNQTSQHMVFAGSAGTGKTTVARLVAQALYENGVLKSSKMVEARQADLVAEYVGKTAPKTKAVIQSALDGVLFIDEAYELAPPKNGGNSFNNEAVTELIADMENYSNRLVVIMAGYTHDMSDFFHRGNAGLQSRFANWIEFPDYTPRQLKLIERYTLKKANARLDNPSVIKTLDKGIDDLLPIVSRSRAGGNGRFVRNYIQKVTEMRDGRLALEDTTSLSDEQLLIIKSTDVTHAVAAMRKQITDMQQ